ncbi:MAG: peptidyl-prolyl cis-trans isomerase [Phycisphaeraceae bacterium]
MQLSKPTTAALLAVGLTLVGCESTWLSSRSDRPSPVVQPDDFIGQPQAQERSEADETPQVATQEPDIATSETTEPINSPRSEQALPVDAMVGHINGEAVYADQVFDVNLVAQLESFGRRFDRDAFRDAAGGVIQDRLQGIIINKLILGEAERNLQANQRRGIEGRIQSEREELLRFYGQGSLAKAKAEFLKASGKELAQHLADFREELVIGSYIRSKVMPKIVVNQRDVERYYADNIDKYQQPDTRVVRLIRAVDEAAAQQINDRLAKGQGFDKLAADPALNQYNPANAGVFNSGNPIPGDQVIGLKPVNEALIKLEGGKHAGPIIVGEATFFVQVVERTPGVKITLAEAQIKIEQILRSTQFEKHALRFRMELLKRGSYSNPAEMGKKLLEIAFARYDQ